MLLQFAIGVNRLCAQTSENAADIFFYDDRMSVMEPAPGGPLIRKADDVSGLVESCLSARAMAALLYPANLPERFFDLSSGEAGAILQKLRQYRIRMAVVADPAIFSTHFAEVEMEERRKGYFAVFASAEEGRAWLNQIGAQER